MKILQRYFATEIISAVMFTLFAFLALFAFFDLIGELSSVGRGGYKLQHAFLYVLLGLPGYSYELMPIAVLIGTIRVMAKFSASSEFTIMRVSSMSTKLAGWMLIKIGFIFMLLTFLFGELLSPMASEAAEKVKLSAKGASVSQEFRSGLWTKDVVKTNGLTGDVVGSRFINVRTVSPGGQLQGVRLYEFDRDFRMVLMLTAASAEYRGANTWRLMDVSETRFSNTPIQQQELTLDGGSTGTITRTTPSKDLVSEITPDILSVLFSDPDRMSAADLSAYTKHLAENNQATTRYAIAFWKKLIYPLAIFVMMALALPFAYLHTRAGGVSLKIFIGIMIGVSFQLLNSLFSHVGLLNTWPPFATAIAPSALFLLMAMGALWWVERH